MSITTTRALTALTSLLTAALIAGCSSDSPTAPSNSSTLDLSSLFSQMSIGNLNAIPGANSALALPATAASPTIVPSACTYSATSGAFTCPPVTAGGLTFTMAFYLYDAAGNPQSVPDPKTTASVRTVTDGSGTLAAPSTGFGSSISFTDHEDMTLSGLLTNTRTLNGTGKSHYDFGAGTSGHLTMDNNTTTSNVVLPSGSTSKWPQSGTIASDLTTSGATAGLSGSFTAHSVITFNGTSTVKIVISSGVASTTCMIDLSGKTGPSCSQIS